MAQSIESVRADLGARIAELERRASSARPAEIAPAVDAIRVIAHANGLNPAVTVAHFVDSALARGDRGTLVRDWLDMLGQAVRSDRHDVAACHVFAAACSVRLAG